MSEVRHIRARGIISSRDEGREGGWEEEPFLFTQINIFSKVWGWVFSAVTTDLWCACARPQLAQHLLQLEGNQQHLGVVRLVRNHNNRLRLGFHHFKSSKAGKYKVSILLLLRSRQATKR